MPRDERVFVVFVASPSDMQPERDALEEVIRELNLTWSRKLGIRLDLVRWETHGVPGFGADAQDVLNRQLPDDPDIFIGLMWGDTVRQPVVQDQERRRSLSGRLSVIGKTQHRSGL